MAVGVGAGVSVGGMTVASGVAVIIIMVASIVGVTPLGSAVAVVGRSEQDMSNNARIMVMDKFRLFLTLGLSLSTSGFLHIL
jgi:hypothetical protein